MCEASSDVSAVCRLLCPCNVGNQQHAAGPTEAAVVHGALKAAGSVVAEPVSAAARGETIALRSRSSCARGGRHGRSRVRAYMLSIVLHARTAHLRALLLDRRQNVANQRAQLLVFALH